MITSVIFLYLLLAAKGEENDLPKLENFQYPDVSSHKNINLLPKNCGVKNKDSDFPWMALLSFDIGSERLFGCGGSIINQNYILTAAHCVTDPDSNLTSIRVGTDNLEMTTDSDEGNSIQDVSVEEVISHPKYDFIKKINDIALVRVSPIDLSSEIVQPICLPVKHHSFNYSDVDLIVTGYDSTNIMATSLSYVPLASCHEKYKSKNDVAQSQLCATCANLAIGGSPLHVVTPRNGKLSVQEGIVSFGALACGGFSLPDVYTRVAFFMDWILDNIRP